MFNKIKTINLLSIVCSCFLYSCSQKPIQYQYGDKEMYEKIWEDISVIHNESCMMIQEPDGKISSTLTFTPTRIISVRDCTLKKEYSPDEYHIEGNKIVLNENSTISFLTQSDVNCDTIPDIIGGTYQSDKTPSKKILFTEGAGIFMMQIYVTYEKVEKWTGHIPVKYGQKFINTYEKINNNEDIKVLFYGASTMTGANSSSVLGMEPFQDSVENGFMHYLRTTYPKVNFTNINTSVGGWTSVEGRKNVVNSAQIYQPDLMVLEFGHNDPSWNINTTSYKENMQFIIDAVRVVSPDCDIILVTPHMANPFSSQYKNHKDYRDVCLELVDENDAVGICDWTTMTDDLQTIGKNSFSMYANNINHPADWIERIFTTLLIQAFEK